MTLTDGIMVLAYGFALGAAFVYYYSGFIKTSVCRVCMVQWLYDIRYRWIKGCVR